ncbi:MAG: hypothetical protein HC817_08710 [Saprospiraceae bacterium]|nr:hypothetical protein [Saprospiraceae bacterium]
MPELQNLPVHLIHEPYNIPPLEAQFLGFDLDRDYFRPIVDLKSAKRKRAINSGQLKNRKKVAV